MLKSKKVTDDTPKIRQRQKGSVLHDAKNLLNTKVLVFSALLCALSVAIGFLCKTYLTFGAIRITFENLPILMAGMYLGPFVGTLVGAVSDMLSCVLSGYGVNPVITLGAACVGAVSGIFFRHIIKRKGFLPTFVSALIAHAFGSMLIKSIGLYLYGHPIQVLLLRIPLYIGIALAESYLIYVITKNREIASRLERL